MLGAFFRARAPRFFARGAGRAGPSFATRIGPTGSVDLRGSANAQCSRQACSRHRIGSARHELRRAKQRSLFHRFLLPRGLRNSTSHLQCIDSLRKNFAPSFLRLRFRAQQHAQCGRQSGACACAQTHCEAVGWTARVSTGGMHRRGILPRIARVRDLVKGPLHADFPAPSTAKWGIKLRASTTNRTHA